MVRGQVPSAYLRSSASSRRMWAPPCVWDLQRSEAIGRVEGVSKVGRCDTGCRRQV